jgi:hypothetical protein
MKPKSQNEEKAAERQGQYLTEALSAAVDSSGYWLNAAGRYYPRFYSKGPEVSPFNALTLGLFADRNGYKTSLYTTFPDSKQRGEGVKENERGVPFNWYNWNEYVNRHNPDEKITREEFLLLDAEERKQYKGIHNREIRVLFNIDQTMTPYVDPEQYQRMIDRYGTLQERGNEKENAREQHITVNNFVKTLKENLVPVRRDGTIVAHYDVARDVVYVPDQKHYPQYMDFVQDLMREIVRATGHQQRCAREGMVMKGGQPPSEEAVKREELVVELAAGVKMLELGLPARLSPPALKLVEGWNRDLREDPQFIDTIEADVNNALDVIRKAEKGEKVTYFSEVNRQTTEELKEKKQPSISSEESAILADIIRNRGMLIADGNFKMEEEKKAFLEKFDLTYYADQLQQAMSMTGHEDPEVVETAYTEALHFASYIDEAARGYKPAEWNNTGTYTIYNALKEMPDRLSRDFVVVTDPERKIADVLLPEGAFSGGKVVLPDGKTRNFYLSPDEAMSAQERVSVGARVQYNELPGMSKQRIAHALQGQGAAYVRFFNTGGVASFYPNDAYFDGKKVAVAKLHQWELNDVRELNISEAVERSRSTTFNRVQMVRDDENRWVLYMAPTGESPLCMHPDKSDINQFFSTSKQGNAVDTERIRHELAQKYYAIAQVNPSLRINIFGEKALEEDTSRITRVNIYKTKDDKFLCAPVFKDMEGVQPRPITTGQWQRLWLSEDANTYKQNLASTLFADILHPEREREQEEVPSAGMKR